MRTLLVVSGALIALAPSLQGQTASLDFGVGWYNPGGDDFANTDSGIGVDGMLRVAWPGGFGVGLGAQLNRHGVPFTDEDDWQVLSLFVQPELELSTGSAARPFAAVRIARLYQEIDVTGGERNASGYGGGPLVGVRFGLSDRISLGLSVPVYHLSFGDFDIDGAVRADTDSSGNAWGGHLSFSIRLGG